MANSTTSSEVRHEVESKIRELLQNSENVNVSQLSRDFGVPTSTIGDWKKQMVKREQMTEKDTRKNKGNDKSDNGSGKAAVQERLDEFSQEFDRSYYIPERIRKVIREWLSDKSVIWARDEDMRKRCEVASLKDWKVYARENPEFENNLVRTPNGKVIWTTAEYREELQRRAMV